MFESMTTKDGSTYEAMVLGLVKVQYNFLLMRVKQIKVSCSDIDSGKHLIMSPKGNSELCLPETLNVSFVRPRELLRFNQ